MNMNDGSQTPTESLEFLMQEMEEKARDETLDSDYWFDMALTANRGLKELKRLRAELEQAKDDLREAAREQQTKWEEREALRERVQELESMEEQTAIVRRSAERALDAVQHIHDQAHSLEKTFVGIHISSEKEDKERKIKRYNFTRYRRGQKMAQGVAVHTSSLQQAELMADKLKPDRSDVLRFEDNRPCHRAVNCPYCNRGKE